MRVRLLAGLKRYLHGKRLNGLLSSQVTQYFRLSRSIESYNKQFWHNAVHGTHAKFSQA